MAAGLPVPVRRAQPGSVAVAFGVSVQSILLAGLPALCSGTLTILASLEERIIIPVLQMGLLSLKKAQ